MVTFIAGQRVNVETADLSGPTAPRNFDGARLLEVFPLVSLVGNVSLGVDAVFYAGSSASWPSRMPMVTRTWTPSPAARMTRFVR